MKIYDTFSKTKKEFIPLKNKRVNLFVCGPTVYDDSHIGHARTYIVFDAFVKYLRSLEYEVAYVQNITDVDDKIIARARELGKTPQELAKTFEVEYLKDMKTLGIESVTRYARATDYIEQIISQVRRLLEKGYAYQAQDGIYYDILRFKDYGKLAHRTAAQAEDAVSRIDESAQKRNKGDFALWKFRNQADEPSWDSPWGKGRPGWHIEDTAISETELGEQYDIHGGARDLIFPHHESEIAQMEAISGKTPMTNFWMHTGFLTVNGKKMSKSLGNFVTIREFLKKYTKETLRLLVLASHYRSPIDYSEKAVQQAEANGKRLEEFYEKITLKGGASDSPLEVKNFYKELGDDFNTPKALASLFDFVRKENSRLDRGKIKAQETAKIKKFLDDAHSILGIIPHVKFGQIPSEVTALVAEREKLREEKKWEEADKVRAKIEALGYIIEDTPYGPKIKKS